MSLHRLVWCVAALLCVAEVSVAQESFVVIHATLHQSDGSVIKNATVEVVSGKIRSIEAGKRPAQGVAKIIDAEGGALTQGLSIVGVPIGLVEVEMESSSVDHRLSLIHI